MSFASQQVLSEFRRFLPNKAIWRASCNQILFVKPPKGSQLSVTSAE
jgi:hypothetical protein